LKKVPAKIVPLTRADAGNKASVHPAVQAAR